MKHIVHISLLLAMLHFSARSTGFSITPDSSRFIAASIEPITPKAPAGYVLLTPQGAIAALMDHRRVIDLESQLRDLTELMEVKDIHIARQERVITELMKRSEELRKQPVAVARSDTDKRKLIWSQIENWGWRGLAAFSVYRILSR